MGGSSIQQVLAAAPERVRALVALTPVSAIGVPFDEQGWQLFSAAGSDVPARRAIIDFTTGNRLTGTWLDAMAASTQTKSHDEAVAGYLQSWAKTSFVDKIQGQQLPVLVLPGEHDPALGEAACRATWMQHYPNAQLEVVRNAGHYPMDETPIILATMIEKFLSGVPE